MSLAQLKALSKMVQESGATRLDKIDYLVHLPECTFRNHDMAGRAHTTRIHRKKRYLIIGCSACADEVDLKKPK